MLARTAIRYRLASLQSSSQRYHRCTTPGSMAIVPWWQPNWLFIWGCRMEGLRAADASIVSALTAGSKNVPSITISEGVADDRRRSVQRHDPLVQP